MLSENKEVARNIFFEFHKEAQKEVFEISDSYKMSSEQIRRSIIRRLEGKEPHVIGSISKEERNKITKEIREQEDFRLGKLREQQVYHEEL